MEEAANELINMLLEFDHNQREEVERVEERSSIESKTMDHIDSEGILTHDGVTYHIKTDVLKNRKSIFVCIYKVRVPHESRRTVVKGIHVHHKCVTSFILGEDEGRSEGRLFSRNTLLPPASVGPSSPLVRRKKKRDLMEVMEEEAQELLSYFNHRNVDALLRLTRNTLEMLRKRIYTSSLMHFLGGSCVTSFGSLSTLSQLNIHMCI